MNCDLHTRLLLQVLAQRLELALQLGGRLVGNRGDAQHALRGGAVDEEKPEQGHGQNAKQCSHE